ncbi:aldehyde reductase, putative [Plasmodium ovale]|uniref:Aldehyde reductase, putative n=2 Tax=Plasmodium ovale TaxID=36330 RepID=A0A1A8VWE6_PLAOA|nr:aldehyde reductase, putative [Plasmodium ovale curtisi]SBS93539.1 aldehyde reductase, putative [Plasmodium ovale curtisi]SCP04859.1 aldehyde reductase, putative [Plasmodium ovale]
MKRKFAIKCMPFIFFLIVLLFFSEIKSKHRNLPSTKNGVRVYRRLYNGSSYRSDVKKKLGDGIGRRSSTTFLLNRMRNGRKNKIVLKYFIKRNNQSIQFKCRVQDKVTKFMLHEKNTFDKKGEDIFYNQMNGDKKENSAYRKDGNEYLNEDGKNLLSYGKKNISKEDEVTYKYVEEMELKKINIRGVDIQYRVYNLEEGIYIVDDENYEKIKKLWNKEELKKAKENFEESFEIKKQGIKEKDWIMLPFDYEENKNIKLVKADFDNPSYDYILTYYDKERNYYWEYKRRNYYKMFRGTIHEIPPYKSELEEDKRFYGKEIIIPKKKLDNKIFRQPMLSDVLTGGCSKEPIGIESWRYVKYPYGNLIKNQKYSQLYCIKKNEKDKPNMRYYYLGSSNLAVSEICLGTMNFGNYIQEKLAHELFDYAYEEFQVNFFDTAEIYPLPVSENYFGQSEEILGNWIKSKGKANRHKIVIATKICGRTNKIPWARKFKTGSKVNINDPTDNCKRNKIGEKILDKDTNSFDKLNKWKKKEELYLNKNYEEIEKMEESENHLYQCDDKKQDNVITLSKDTILASVDNCLKRLKTNYIDLLQLHWPDRYYPNQSSGDFSDVLYDYTKYSHDFIPFVEQLQAIDELKKKGKIREWGLSNETPFGLLKFYELCKHLHISPPVSIQLEYNLLCRNDVEKGFLEICRPQNTNISILAYSPLCAGILTGKYLEYTDYTTKGRMQKFPSYMKRLRGSIATYIIRELYYLSQKYYFPNLTVAALKWVYTRSFVTSTVIGVSDFLQLRENLYSLTENVLFTDKLEREINALHWKFRDPIRIIQ